MMMPNLHGDKSSSTGGATQAKVKAERLILHYIADMAWSSVAVQILTIPQN